MAEDELLITATGKADVPDHVDPSRVVDFDIYRPGEPGADPIEAWQRLRDAPDIVWTPHHGGHWIANRGEDIMTVLMDWKRFSSRSVFIPTVDRPRTVPLEYDPPEHKKLKQLIMPAFSAKAVGQWSEEADALAEQLLDEIAPQGRCEFIGAFAQQLPIVIFLRMMDLPMSDREALLKAVSSGVRPENEEEWAAGRRFMAEYIEKLVAERTANPGDDIFSQALVTGVDGEPLTHDQAVGLATSLLGGGLDTVASSMGWIALFLAENPEHRRQLVDDPDLIPKAVDELLRRFAIPNIARVVAEDTELGGVPLKAGERILVSACMHSLDTEVFSDPRTVDFGRANAGRHCAFSQGVHRCIGAQLALQELRIFLRHWLARIPDFTTDPDDPPVMATGIAHGLSKLTLKWETKE